MNATTIVITITVEGSTASFGDRIAALLDRNWDAHHLPNRLAQDIRVHRHDASAIGDILNKTVLGEME